MATDLPTTVSECAPLCAAVDIGQEPAVKPLLAPGSGASPIKASADGGCTPLAAAFGLSLETVAKLPFKGGAGRTVETKGGETASHVFV